MSAPYARIAEITVGQSSSYRVSGVDSRGPDGSLVEPGIGVISTPKAL
jgi:hypothetical protein